MGRKESRTPPYEIRDGGVGEKYRVSYQRKNLLEPYQLVYLGEAEIDGVEKGQPFKLFSRAMMPWLQGKSLYHK